MLPNAETKSEWKYKNYITSIEFTQQHLTFTATNYTPMNSTIIKMNVYNSYILEWYLQTHLRHKFDTMEFRLFHTRLG